MEIVKMIISKMIGLTNNKIFKEVGATNANGK